MLRKATFLLAVVLFATTLSTVIYKGGSVSAVTGADWRAGQIIDDAVFTNKAAMSVAQIQEFLNSTVGTGGSSSATPGVCDTNGVKTSELGGGTRAQYGAAHGNPIPFTCLKDYYEVPKTSPGPGVPASNYGGAAIPAGARSAAQLIWDAAQINNISPKVLLVTIQKESVGPLTTDDWPFQKQYTYAMGAHCPDSGPGGSANCDPNYAGFSIQISESAALFRWYLDNMNQPWWSYKKVGNNAVLYHPNASACGSSNVYIETAATAALYTYTPYQPNATALSNLYGGQSDGCSSYGNRNFWRMYNDWFGSTTNLDPSAFINSLPVTIISQPVANPAIGQKVNYVVSYKNNFSSPITLDSVGIVGRAGDIKTGANRDFGWQGPITIAPGASQQFTFSTTITDLGTTYMWPTVLYKGNFVQYNNWGTTVASHTPNLTFSQPLTMSPTTVYAGQNVTFSAVLKNNEPYPISYSALGIPVRFYDRYNYDAAWVGPGEIASGAEITLSGTRNIDKPGPFTYWVSNSLNGMYSTVGSVNKFSSSEASPSFSVPAISFSNTTPVNGENLGATFTITNNLPVPIDVDGVGIVGRLGTFSGLNRDIGWQGPVHFNANETKTFTGSRVITDVGTHYYWIGVLYKGGYIQYNNWGSTIVSH